MSSWLVIAGPPTEEDLARRSAPGSVTLMGPSLVVEIEVAVERGLQDWGAGEVPSAELDPLQLAEDGALQPLGKAVGLCAARLGTTVADAPRGANLVEGSPVFVALIGQDASHRPTGSPDCRQWVRKRAAAAAEKAGLT